ncbi:MAG: pyridoxamine 5'-phosphate oxidase family protein [Thermomicrobiales bacterium]
MQSDSLRSGFWLNLLDPLDLERVQLARFGHLATVGVGGFPTVVPICFAMLEATDPIIVSVLDEKVKRVSDAEIGRVRNIRQHAEVGLTIDHFEEDWSRLWYIQFRGVADIESPESTMHTQAISALRTKYGQYVGMDLEDRLLIVIRQLRVKVWHA